MKLVENKRGQIINWAETITYGGMQFAQNLVDMGVWLAAFEKVKKDGGSDEQARDYADGLVERTQASGNISARPKAMHGSHFERLAMMITMVSHGLRGRLYEQATRAKAEGKSINLARLTFLTWAVVVPRLMERVARDAIEQLGDDDEDEYDPEIAELTFAILSDTANAAAPQVAQIVLPFIGGAIQTGLQVGRPYSEEPLGLGPVKNPIRRGIRGINATARAFAYGVPMTMKEKGDVLVGATMLTGLPLVVVDKYLIPFIELNTPEWEKEELLKTRREILNEARDNS